MASERFVFWRSFTLQILLFFFLLPFIVLLTIRGLDTLFEIPAMLSTNWSTSLFALSFAVGSVFMFLSNYYIFVHGRGTPLEVAGRAVKQTRYLQRKGPYAIVRNPMAFGFVLMYVAGAGFLLNSWMTIPLVALSFLSLVIYLRTWEEKGLERRFGSAYIKYRSEVPAVIPRLTPLHVDPKEEIKIKLPPVLPLFLLVMAIVWTAFALITRSNWQAIIGLSTRDMAFQSWMPFLAHSTWFGLNIGLTVFALGGLPEFNQQKASA